MESEAGDNFEDFYEDGDASKHEKLVEKVLSLNKTQHLKKPSRTEPALKVSEFNLVKSITGEKGSIQIDELTKSLKHRKSRVKINEKFKQTAKRTETLPKPLEKPQADRIRRGVAYEKTRLQLDRWEPIVTSNRVAPQLSFPLQDDVKLDKKLASDFPNMWRLKSDLEVELEKLEPKVEEYHVDVEEQKIPLTLKEMLAKRKESAKLRAYQSYQEAKARKQNKIKSKKYHRIEKRAKLKQRLAEFEQLKETNPEAALKKLEEIELARMEERFTLRHKTTGRWARTKAIRAKYDKESRKVLAQQLIISRDLTQKTKTNKDSDNSDSEIEEVESKKTTNDSENVWVNGVKTSKEVSDFVSGYRKYWTEQNQTKNNETGENEENNDAIISREELSSEPSPVSVTNKEVDAKHVKRTNKTKENEEMKKVTEKELVSEDAKGVQNEKENHSNEKKKRNLEKKENVNRAKRVKKLEKEKSNFNGSMGTSEWTVTPTQDSVNEVSIEHMFDCLENKIQKQRLKKVTNLKKNIEKNKKQKNVKNPKTEEYKPDLTMPLQVKRPIIDEELVEESGEKSIDVNTNVNVSALKAILTNDIQKETPQIDPNKYSSAKVVNLSAEMPDFITTEDNEENNGFNKLFVDEFEDCELVNDFNKEKKQDIDKNKPKDINLTLPGWGSWGGTKIKINPRKQRRFTIKAPPKMPRKDDNKGSLIINESAQSKIRAHKVSELPFPFQTVKDYEASVRAPISNTFVPESAYRKLIRPPVVTKMGAIIKPMSKNMLLNKK